MATYAHSSSQVPDGDHFAIIYFRSVTIPKQGHGYPEYDESVCDYVVFPDRESWEAAVREESLSTYGRKNFKPIFARSAKIETQVKVNIS